MIKKLLFIFITIFVFSNVNAQTNIVGDLNCPGSNINEFEDDGLNTDGKISYRRLNDGDTLTSWGTTNGASLGASGVNAGIRWSIGNSQWEYYSNAFIAMINTSDSVLPPVSGWTAPSICVSLDLYLEVLSVDKLEDNINKISVYPNPSSDFIYISNINDATLLRVTNITGQTVMSTIIDTNNNQIDIKGLSKGFYFLEIEGKKTIKLIKK